MITRKEILKDLKKWVLSAKQEVIILLGKDDLNKKSSEIKTWTEIAYLDAGLFIVNCDNTTGKKDVFPILLNKLPLHILRDLHGQLKVHYV